MTEAQATTMIANQEIIITFLSQVFPSALVAAFGMFGVFLGRLAAGVFR